MWRARCACAWCAWCLPRLLRFPYECCCAHACCARQNVRHTNAKVNAGLIANENLSEHEHVNLSEHERSAHNDTSVPVNDSHTLHQCEMNSVCGDHYCRGNARSCNLKFCAEPMLYSACSCVVYIEYCSQFIRNYATKKNFTKKIRAST